MVQQVPRRPAPPPGRGKGAAVHACIGAREVGDVFAAFHARVAVFLQLSGRLGGATAVDGGDEVGQLDGVFDGLAGALAEEGSHGVGGWRVMGEVSGVCKVKGLGILGEEAQTESKSQW